MTEFTVEDIPRLTAELFDNGGLERAFGTSIDPRPQQRELSVAVAECLSKGGKLVAEAPTGVGKTFAYLAPAALMAKATGRPAWVATGTIGLQDQLMGKDLPAVEKALGFGIRGAAAKGRANYLCWTRLERLVGLAGSEDAPPPSWMAAVASWAETSPDGDRSSFTGDGKWWFRVASDDMACLGAECPHRPRCFLARARGEAAMADVVVLNHSLALASLRTPNAEFAPPRPCCIVFDEAHGVEAEASDQFGMRLAQRRLEAVLGGVAKAVPECAPQCMAALAAVKKWFASLVYDMMRRGHGDGPASPGKFMPPSDWLEDALADAAKAIARSRAPFAAAEAVRQAAAAARAYAGGDVPWEGETARWLEAPFGNPSIAVEPAFPSPLLEESLPPGTPVVAVSATVAGDKEGMRLFAEGIGMKGADVLRLPSPFDCHGLVTCLVARSLPLPSDPAFHEAAVPHMVRILEMTEGRAFLLFSSMEALRECAMLMEKDLRRRGMTPVVQDGSEPVARLVARFLASEKPVLFGAASFREGVDIPGGALSNVIVVKLPFPSPGDPMEEARARWLGDRWFPDSALPAALTAFRQGIGRLVRRRGDGGIIAVMDPRPTMRWYGRYFIDALPVPPSFF